MLLCTASLFAQEKKGNDFSSLLINITYAGQLPGGDLANEYTENLSAGTGIQYLTKKKWLLGVEANYMFGGNLKQDILANMRTEEGEVINGDQGFAVVFLEKRGFYAGLLAGKIIPVSKKNPNSGIRLTAGAGILQHKIRIQDRTGGLPQLAGEYLKGYDRLTNGFALSEFIGYQHISENLLVNFIAGFEFTQGFTKNRRSWDFTTNQSLNEPRLDLLNGFKVGWVLSINSSSSYSADDIFY